MDDINPYHSYKSDNLILFECRHCHSSIKLEIVAEYEMTKEIPFDGQPYLFTFKYVLCKCDYCSEISLVEIIDEPERIMVIYPAEKRFITLELPERVKTSYIEAIRCEKARIPLATVVMVGRTLEALIREFYPDQETLFDGLEKLKNENIISSEIYEWANELRVLRNIGAHAKDETVVWTDAEESMDFLQVILEIIYDLRPKLMKMKERREKSKQDTGNII
jgi:hypothetical protein